MKHTERERAIKKLEIAIDKVMDAKILGANLQECERILEALNSVLNSLRR